MPGLPAPLPVLHHLRLQPAARARSMPGARRPAHGFTLIELMIAVVIVGLLGALAYPAFTESIRKSRRAEAFAALAQVQQAQEAWRSNRPEYSSVLGPEPGTESAVVGLRLRSLTPSGYYQLSLAGSSATSYTALATALAGTSQAADGNCRVLGVRLTAGGNILYGGAATSIDWSSASTADPARCWAR